MNLLDAMQLVRDQIDAREQRDGYVAAEVMGVFIEYELHCTLRQDPENRWHSPFNHLGGPDTFMGYPLFLVRERGTQMQPPVLAVLL